MCVQMALGALAGLGGGAAATTAAGAAAGASTLSTIGTLVSVGGSIFSGLQGMAAARAQSKAIEGQKQTEARLNAIEESRARSKFLSAIASQRAELAARGVDLSSPTAIALGQTAAQEMSFEGQSIRSTGQARQIELTNEQRFARARGGQAMLKGIFSGADTLLSAPPDVWRAFRRTGATA